VDVNAETSPLPPANRDGGIDQDWAGDDQDWWVWYVTLAENDDAPATLVAGPGRPDGDPADDEQLRAELAAPYQLDAAQREAFRRDAFIKLPQVLSPVSGRWRDFLPGVEPGGLAASELNPIVAGREGESTAWDVSGHSSPVR